LWVGEDDITANELYVWLGGPGIGPGLHYDMDHNFFMQMVGRKRFILFPPWETKNLYPNPSIHPCNRKAQVDFDDPDLETYPKFKNAKAFVAILNPGDLLYIPPFWWHKVHSLTQSVSLSALSASGIYHKLKKLYERDFVIDNLTKKEKISATIAFLDVLLEELYGEGATEFVSNLLESRWIPMVHHFEEPTTDFCKNQSDFDKEIFKHDVKNTIEAFKNCQVLYGIPIHSSRLDMKAIIETEVSDFIEIIASNTVGPENVYHFLKMCLLKQYQ